MRDLYSRIVNASLHTHCEILLTRHYAARAFSPVGFCEEGLENASEVKIAISTLKARRIERQRIKKTRQLETSHHQDAQ